MNSASFPCPIWHLVTGLSLSLEYNLADVIRYAKGLLVSDRILSKEIIQSNLPQEVPVLKIPCYFVTGNYDYLTPIQTANNYFNAIIAPSEKFVVFNDSAHFPHFEEKDNFYSFINSLHLFIGEEHMKKKSKLSSKSRTRSLFNTGTRPHKSNKDYTRRAKHKENSSEDGV